MKVILDREDCNNLIIDLSEKYKLLLHGMKKKFIKNLGISIEEEDQWIMDHLAKQEAQLLGGDLIYIAPETVMYYKVPSEKELVEAGVIGDVSLKEFDEFTAAIKESILDALEDPEQKWEPVKKLDQSYKMLIEKARTIKPGEEDILAAIELEDEENRTLMKVIRTKDSIFMDKLMEEAKAENIEDNIKVFSDLGLVNTDFAVICNKTGQQILRIPDKSALDEISQKGFKCFICGSSISKEKLVRAISCSDFGKKVLEDEYWFLVLVLNALNSLDIPFEESYIQTGETPDTNIFLNINNEAVMLQLINRKLSLDDAFLINAHIAAYKLNYLILISTQPFSELMKSHLQTTNPDCSIHFIEGLENLSGDIHDIFIEKEKIRLEETLKNMTELTPIPIEELLMKKVIPGGKTEPVESSDELLLDDLEDDNMVESFMINVDDLNIV